MTNGRKGRTTPFRLLLVFGPILLFIALTVHILSKPVDQGSIATTDYRALKNIELDSFSLQTKKDSLSSLPENHKIFVFWASHCTSCHQTWHIIRQLSQEEGFDLIGINTQDNYNAAQNFLIRKGDPFRFKFMDKKGKFLYQSGFIGLPAFLICDQHGHIRYRHNGRLSRKTYETEIKPILCQMQKERKLTNER